MASPHQKVIRDGVLQVSQQDSQRHASAPGAQEIYIPIPAFPTGISDPESDEDEPEQPSSSELAAWTARMRTQYEEVAAWLSDTEDQPLSIRICEMQPSSIRQSAANFYQLWPTPSAPYPETAELIELVQNHAGQWIQLEITASPAFAAWLLAVPAPSLTHLKVIDVGLRSRDAIFDSGPGSPAVDTEPALWEDCRFPALRRWFVKTLPRRDILLFPVDWSNVTELYFEGYNAVGGSRGSYSKHYRPVVDPFGPADALRLLSATPRLRRCCLKITLFNGFAHPYPTPFPTDRLVQLPELEHLAIIDTVVFTSPRDREACAALFDVLRCPALRSLTHRWAGSIWVHPAPPPIQTLALAVGGHLRSLAIEHTLWRPVPLRELLLLTSDTLEELWLGTARDRGGPTKSWQPARALMADLIVPAPGARRFPRLRKLYYDSAGDEVDADWVLALVRARRSPALRAAGAIHVLIEDVEVVLSGRPDPPAPGGLEEYTVAFPRTNVITAGDTGEGYIAGVPVLSGDRRDHMATTVLVDVAADGRAAQAPAADIPPPWTVTSSQEGGAEGAAHADAAIFAAPLAADASVDLGPQPALCIGALGDISSAGAARLRAVRSGSLALTVLWPHIGKNGGVQRGDAHPQATSEHDSRRDNRDEAVDCGEWRAGAGHASWEDRVVTDTGALLL